MIRYSSFRVLFFVITLLFLTFTACAKRNIDFSDIAFSKLGNIIKHIASPAHVPSSPSHTIEEDAFPAQSKPSKPTKDWAGTLAEDGSSLSF
jgi:hypothetical protein